MSSTPKAPEVIPMHEVKNCIAYYNSNKGFYANHHPGGILWSNNSSYMNPSNYCMLNRKSIERALARAAGHQDESVVARLALFAPALLKAADLRAQLAAEAPEWTDEEIEAARLGKETLLSLRPVTIDSERFLQTVDAIAAALLDNDEIEGDMLDACRAVDWTRFVSAELLEIAGRDPMGYLHAVEVHAGEDDLLDICLLPVLGLALRVFLDDLQPQRYHQQ